MRRIWILGLLVVGAALAVPASVAPQRAAASSAQNCSGRCGRPSP